MGGFLVSVSAFAAPSFGSGLQLGLTGLCHGTSRVRIFRNSNKSQFSPPLKLWTAAHTGLCHGTSRGCVRLPVDSICNHSARAGLCHGTSSLSARGFGPISDLLVWTSCFVKYLPNLFDCAGCRPQTPSVLDPLARVPWLLSPSSTLLVYNYGFKLTKSAEQPMQTSRPFLDSCPARLPNFCPAPFPVFP